MCSIWLHLSYNINWDNKGLYMTLRAALALVLCGLIAGTRAYTASTCPSTIPESSRKDCMPGVYSDESSCNAKGCMWCESSYQGPPWCFYNDGKHKYWLRTTRIWNICIVFSFIGAALARLHAWYIWGPCDHYNCDARCFLYRNKLGNRRSISEVHGTRLNKWL